MQHRTWLGSARAASCGIGAERRQWRKQRGGDRDSKGALARLLGSPDRNTVRGQRPGENSTEFHSTNVGCFLFVPAAATLPEHLSQIHAMYLAR